MPYERSNDGWTYRLAYEPSPNDPALYRMRASFRCARCSMKGASFASQDIEDERWTVGSDEMRERELRLREIAYADLHDHGWLPVDETRNRWWCHLCLRELDAAHR